MRNALRSTVQLLKRGAIRSTLNAMGHAGIGKPAGQDGAGLIMTLHRVEPALDHNFSPNARLTITPDFLETMTEVAKEQGMVPIALCDVKDYIGARHDKPFIAFTLDDAYKNNAQFAAPIFRRHSVPYTIFVSKGLSERTHTMWWETAEQLIRKVDQFWLNIAGENHHFLCNNLAKKHQCFDEFTQLLLKYPEDMVIQALNDAAQQVGLAALDITAQLVMDRTALLALDKDPLCHLAPHTVSHINLARATPTRLQTEITESAAYIRALTGPTPSSRVFSYPYGKPFATSEAVFNAAAKAQMDYGVITSAGAVKRKMTRMEWMSLPRMSVNGHYQTRPAAHALLCGVPTLFAKRKSA